MKKIANFLLCIIILLVLAGCCPVKVIGVPKPDIYIIGPDVIYTFDDRKVYILEYTINGEYQSPGFHKPEEIENYMAYLAKIGNIHKGAEE